MGKPVPSGKVSKYPELGYNMNNYLEVDTQCQSHQVWLTLPNSVPMPLSVEQVIEVRDQLNSWLEDRKNVV